MEHNVPLITTIAAGFGLALILGFLAERIKVPTLVGCMSVESQPFAIRIGETEKVSSFACDQNGRPWPAEPMQSSEGTERMKFARVA